jgi:anti-sigma28 factor (negative regulator of flagellin synthesis)
MKVNDPSRLTLAEAPGKTDPAVPRGKPQKPEGAADETADRAELSAAGQTALGGADPERLAALQRQIDSGTYQVSAEEMAKAIVDAHLMKRQ